MSRTELKIGALLVATPQNSDEHVARGVILIVAHYENGAAGVMLSHRPFPGFDYQKLIVGEVGRDPLAGCADPMERVRWGGPVALGSVTALHDRIDEASSGRIGDSGCAATHPAHLADIRTDNKLLTYGFAAWENNDLVEELKNTNDWLIIEADAELIFKTPPEQMWEAALKRAGIDKARNFYALAPSGMRPN